ncbi:MAG: DUF1269 domain-containing protein [Actinomycetota bacterium]
MAGTDLVVFTFPDEDGSTTALQRIVTAKQENTHVPLIAVNDAAVAIKNDRGKVKVRQTLESAIKGSRVAGGGFWGLLIGLLFGGPLLGAVIGAGIRAFSNRNIDFGIDNDFIADVSNSLEPGQSALFLLAADTTPADIDQALGDHDGTLFHTTLSDETTDAMNDLAGDDEITSALAAEDEEG